ncbi:MAG: molybdopterin-dependent oxidoreductase [Panacagrimonas sp.]
MNNGTASAVEKKIYCGICEASCGLIATVQDDEILKMRGDPDHPQSEGFICPKGASFASIRNDPDRVLHPLERQPDGSFKPVSWDEALDDIGRRLGGIIKQHGTESVGVYLGNPNAWNYGAFLWLFGMAAALKTRHFYTASSGDINNYWVVGHLLYGHNLSNPFPDVTHTQFLIVLGSNLTVSHGSMMTVGRVKEKMQDIVARGGRVVVIDPRRTETAQQFEWQPLKPDGDPWLVASMLKTLFDEKRVDEATLREQTTGWESLPTLLAGITPQRVEAETGMRHADIQQLARDFKAAPSAALYGRCGASLGPFSTLTKYLIDVFNIATGNLDKRGGVVFGRPMIDTELFTKLFKADGYDRWRTRVDNFPEVLGTAPLASLPREIRTPGKGQMRALIIGAGNIASTSCASNEVSGALAELELLVSLDPYITETNRQAHYILPPTLWIERDGMPIFTQMHNAVPYAQWVPATVSPRGESRDDWWIIDQICKRIGLVPSALQAAQWLGKIGIRISPKTAVDLFMRLAPEGDWFGLRPKGLSRKKLYANPGGIKLAEAAPVGVWRKKIHHKDKKIHLQHALIETEMERMLARPTAAAEDFPLRLISMRELQSQNSWLHNSPRLMTANRIHRLRMNPRDAQRLGLFDTDTVSVTSRSGSIKTPIQITDEMMEGVVALPQSWGHRGGWKHAVAAGGSSYNALTSNAADEMDKPSGNAVLNGIVVRVERVAAEVQVAA